MKKNIKKQVQEKHSRTYENLDDGLRLHDYNPLFLELDGWPDICDGPKGKNSWAAKVSPSGRILLNQNFDLSPKEWVWVYAHCKLHLAFGHFDADKMPGYEVTEPNGTKRKVVSCNPYLWNMACDIYVAKFLADVKFGTPICKNPADVLPVGTKDELEIYEYLAENHFESRAQEYGTANVQEMDMLELNHPLVYDTAKGEKNEHMETFARELAASTAKVVSEAGGHGEWHMYLTRSEEAAQWFINRYPLLGSVASGFSIIEDRQLCYREEIQIAAVDASVGEIYVNPASDLEDEELRFVLAHEFLHAGLQHQERCQGRNPYLWNVACDYVVNGWLMEMDIGKMPEQGLLYDESLKGISAESLYDRMLGDMRRYLKEATLRGYGKGDILGGGMNAPGIAGRKNQSGVALDDFYRDALMQGLEYQRSTGRGYIPAGLIEEIRALAMPPIPWDVELARWFDECFPALEKKRSYARPSRRQGATPDIPKPRYVKDEAAEDGRTFGVVVDTSGSMSTKLLGMALGSIASYAAAKNVPFARVVFCDAAAYDAGYLAPEEIAGRVEVKGRGGTRLQPGVDLLERAEDFPKDGPILIITDGEIEDKMQIRHEHAFLVPKGKRLPFRGKGKVFYFQ